MKRLFLQLGKLLSVRFVAIGLTLVQSIILTRVFGPETFGQLSFGLSVSALTVMLLSAGMDQVLMRDIARIGLGRIGTTARWRDIRFLILRVVLPVSLVAAILGLLIFTVIGMGGVYTIPLVGVAVTLPIILARKFMESVSLGAKQALRSLVGTQLAYPALMALGALVVWFTGQTTGIVQATWVFVVASLGSLAIALVLAWPLVTLIRDAERGELEDGTPEEAAEQSPGCQSLITSGSHLALVTLGFLLGQHIDVLLVGILAGPEDVALVRIASRIAEMAALIRTIAVLQFKPLIAEAFGKKALEEVQNLATTMAKLFVGTGLPIAICLWLFAEEAMGVFGPEFVEGGWMLRIYVVGVLAMMIGGPGNVVLSLCDQESTASRNLMITTALQITLDLALIPLLGGLGCAISNMFSQTLLAVLSANSASDRVGVRTSILSAVKYRR